VSKLELATRLADRLQDYSRQNSELAGWRFDLQEARGFEVGLKNNRIGGPYSAPAYKRSISGELYLIWANQRFTSAKLDSKVLEEFQEYMNLWQTTAYFDPDGVALYRPERIPSVDLADKRVQQIIDEQDPLPFQLLEQGLQSLAAWGVNKIDGKVRCYEGNRVLINSDGLKVEYPQTPVDFYFEANDSYGESYREKKWPTEQEIQRIIENTGHIAKLLTTDVQRDFSGKMQLLLPPGIFESFLGQFLITNLYGSLVVNRQSRFSLTDFMDKRQVLRRDLSVEVNTLLPYRSLSYPCTSEFVPGGAISFIEAGRLQIPVLSLKYARKAALQPTPSPAGGFFFKTTKQLSSWDELIKQTERGMIVYSILGLHTQDASSGHFSLTADQCLLVEHGEIVGKVKGVINGDFLGALLQEESRLGAVEGEDNPGFAFMATVAG
jgi:PmbA protein